MSSEDYRKELAAYQQIKLRTLSPVVNVIQGFDHIIMLVDEKWKDPGCTAQDFNGKDITKDIVVEPLKIDTSVVGSHVITYRVRDPDTNTETLAIRTVYVVDIHDHERPLTEQH